MRPLALTMGEPAGIGGEIALAAWQALRSEGPVFFVIDDPARLEALAFSLGWRIPVAAIAEPEEAPARFATALPVLPLRLAATVVPGKPDPRNAPAVIGAIERAVALAREGRAASVVTNPISKEALYGAGFAYPGHTEFLAALTGGDQPVMMLVGPELRVVPVTVHVSLRNAIAMLDTALILRLGRITAASLVRDFGVARPRLAVAGLNPHAGEGGALGTEDREIVAPAIAALAAEGIDAAGPYPPDTMFTSAARRRYDAALCMYHDQALIPLKTLDMAQGVNVTLGLPIVRTSPDHGTAFDIAGRGCADPASLIAALRLASTMAARREGAR
ncbi:MAG TPA: 4-hydroxythreonine-4-phosphate dehydrogenase PdxA [Acetobacteraceae bacterium]|nr:4-hydroxythreonine-4-phosphate dehydrogenase PdxA [Acetobacteraceae bacterium]